MKLFKVLSFSNMSILNRALLFTSVSIFGISFLVSIFIIRASIKEADLNLQNALSADLVVIPVALTDSIIVGDFATLKQVLLGYVHDRDIKTIRYKSISSTNIEVNDNVRESKYPSWFAKLTGIKDIAGSVDITVGGVNYGRIEVVLTPNYYIDRLWEQNLAGLLMFVIFIFVSTFFVWYTLKRSLLPALADIENATMAISNGDLSFRVDENSTKELRSTLKAFNAMALAIEEDRKKLKDAKFKLYKFNEELSDKVAIETAKRLEYERMLFQQSKMALMGEMIGAIAHQWRQPLNSLGLSIQDANLAYKFGDINDEYMDKFKNDSMSTIQRMSKTIDDFRNFFNPNKTQEEFSIEKAVSDTLNIMSPQLTSHNIFVEFNSFREHIVHGYKNELEQVLLILISNAKDALSDNKDVQNSKINIDISTEANGNLKVVVQDNAGGVPALIIDRIFEPYFTTKEQGKGTGIGLYMAKEIIERQMGGKIYVENTVLGASFTIILKYGTA